MSNRVGEIDISELATPPEKHELYTARYFADQGKNIRFIRPSSIPELYRPDIVMDGIEWELKSPIGKGKKTIEHNMHKAAKQSKYIVFDLRRISLSEKQCMLQLEREFNKRGYIRKLLVIKKGGELIVFSRE